MNFSPEKKKQKWKEKRHYSVSQCCTNITWLACDRHQPRQKKNKNPTTVIEFIERDDRHSQDKWLKKRLPDANGLCCWYTHTNPERQMTIQLFFFPSSSFWRFFSFFLYRRSTRRSAEKWRIWKMPRTTEWTTGTKRLDAQHALRRPAVKNDLVFFAARSWCLSINLLASLVSRRLL